MSDDVKEQTAGNEESLNKGELAQLRIELSEIGFIVDGVTLLISTQDEFEDDINAARDALAPGEEIDLESVLMNKLDMLDPSTDDQMTRYAANAAMRWITVNVNNPYFGETAIGATPELDLLSRLSLTFAELTEDKDTLSKVVTSFSKRGDQLFDHIEEKIRTERQGYRDGTLTIEEGAYDTPQNRINSLSSELHYLQNARLVFGPMFEY